MANALEQPVDCWLEQTEVLLLGKFGMAVLDCKVVMLVHELNHNHEVLLLVWVDSVAHSSKVGASVGSAERLCDTSDHLCKTKQVVLLDSTLDKSVTADQSKLKIDTG